MQSSVVDEDPPSLPDLPADQLAVIASMLECIHRPSHRGALPFGRTLHDYRGGSHRSLLPAGHPTVLPRSVSAFAAVCKAILQKLRTARPEVFVYALHAAAVTELEQHGVWTVRHVKFCYCLDYIAPQRLMPLAACTHIMSLDFSSMCSCAALDIKPLESLAMLEKLDLYSCDLVSLEPLAKLPRLCDLNLARTDVGRGENSRAHGRWRNPLETDLPLEPLGACRSLRTLCLYRNESLTDISCLENCANLHTLDLTETSALQDISPLARCPALHTLEWRGYYAPIVDLSALARAPCLQVLDISGLGDLEDVSPLRNCKALRELRCEKPYAFREDDDDEDEPYRDGDSPSLRGVEDVRAVGVEVVEYW